MTTTCNKARVSRGIANLREEDKSKPGQPAFSSFASSFSIMHHGDDRKANCPNILHTESAPNGMPSLLLFGPLRSFSYQVLLHWH